MHSNASTDPIYRAALDHASKSTGGKVDKLCMSRHMPIGVVTGEATPSRRGISAVANRGVSYEVCYSHKLPTGFPEGHEMWLDFKVTDALKRVVYLR